MIKINKKLKSGITNIGNSAVKSPAVIARNRGYTNPMTSRANQRVNTKTLKKTNQTGEVKEIPNIKTTMVLTEFKNQKKPLPSRKRSF